MTREGASVKARRYLAEGRLTVSLVSADEIRAACRGDGALYQLGWNPADRWWCDCPAFTTGCAHLAALKLVTVRTMLTSARD